MSHVLVVKAETGITARSPAPLSATRLYENALLLYLISLLYFNPYGLFVRGAGNVRIPDLLGLLCVVIGLAALSLRGRIRLDGMFLFGLAPFVLLEFLTPFVGAFGSGQPALAVSGLRLSLFWLPVVCLTMIGDEETERRFERRLGAVLSLTLWLNAAYALSQIGTVLGYLPQSALFTASLEPFAVDSHFRPVQGLRPAGFFVNVSELSRFAIVVLCFFFARYIVSDRGSDLRNSLLALLLVLLTTSRTTAVVAGLIILVGWLYLDLRRKAILLVVIGVSSVALGLLIEATVGIDNLFFRFQRLAEGGLEADVSLESRLYDSWPNALAIAAQYPFGTLVSAPRVVELVDSGYLTYYIQGRFMFVGALAVLLISIFAAGLRHSLASAQREDGLMMLFIAIFLTLALVTSNPLRSPVVVFFIAFTFWKSRAARCRLASVRETEV